MAAPPLSENFQAALEAAIGYLNFSSGAYDPKFFQALDQLLSDVPPISDGVFNGLALKSILEQGLKSLQGTSPAFADTAQAEQIRRHACAAVACGGRRGSHGSRSMQRGGRPRGGRRRRRRSS